MPKIIFSYIKGLVIGYRITATGLSRQFGLSHDEITRMLVSRFPWKRWFVFCIHHLFGILQGGYLIIDDTVLAKPFGKLFTNASYIYSSSDNKPVFGYNIVMIVWTNGKISIPLSWRWYRPNSYSKVEIAMLLLEEIRYKWKIKNCIVLYDCWYAAAKVMRLINSLDYSFVSQIKKNRKVNNIPFNALSIRDNHLFKGRIVGEIQIYYFKHEDKYYCTNISNKNTKQIHNLYQIRWMIEEVFRFLKTDLRLEMSSNTNHSSKDTPCQLYSFLLDISKRKTRNSFLSISLSNT
jgi:hypothetical protein